MANCTSILSRIDVDQRLYFVITFCILSILASLGNTIVLYLFIRYKRLRTSTNRFLVSLAIGDLLLGVVLAPVSIAQLLIPPYRQNCAVNILGNFLTTLMAISGVTLGCIAYDRYLHVKSTEMYRQKMTRCKLNLMIILPWFTPLILLITKMFDAIVNTVTVLVLMTSVYTVLLYSYSKLMVLVKNRIRRGDISIDSIQVRNRNITNCIGWIVLVAIICTVPVFLNRVCLLIYLTSKKSWTVYENWQPLIFAVSHTFFVLNSCINPILYFWKHAGFRNRFKKMIRRGRKIKIYPIVN